MSWAYIAKNKEVSVQRDKAYKRDENGRPKKLSDDTLKIEGEKYIENVEKLTEHVKFIYVVLMLIGIKKSIVDTDEYTDVIESCDALFYKIISKDEFIEDESIKKVMTLIDENVKIDSIINNSMKIMKNKGNAKYIMSSIHQEYEAILVKYFIRM